MKREFLRARSALEHIEEGRSQVARIKRTVAYLEAKCTARTSGYGMRSGGSGGTLEDLWARLADTKKELYQRENRLRQENLQLEGWIDQMPKPRWRMVLRYHYLEGLDLHDVAEALSEATGREYSMSLIYRLHREALQYAEETWPLPPISAAAPADCVPTRSGSCPGTKAVTARRRAAAAAGPGLNED